MTDTVQEKGNILLDSINELDNLVLNVDGTQCPAKIYGSKLGCPYVSGRLGNGGTIDAEISWALAERILIRLLVGDTVIVDY